MMRTPVVALIALTAIVFGHAQTVADALRSSPKRVTVSDLPESYRAVALGDGGMGSLGIYAFAALGGTQGRDDRSKLFANLLGATFVDPEEFAALLERKRPRIRAYTLDLAGMMQEGPSGDSVPNPVFAETWIEGGRIVQWSPRPALTHEALTSVFNVPGRPNIAAEKTKTLSNAKQVALGLMMYAGDYDDKFPIADATAKAQAAVFPYIKNADVWKSFNPNGGRLLFNTALSRIISTSLESPSETLLVWDEKPWPDGFRIVAYADGHATMVQEAQWVQLWDAELRRRKASARPSKAK